MSKSTLGAIFRWIALVALVALGAILFGIGWYMSPPIMAAIIAFWYVKKSYQNREEG